MFIFSMFFKNIYTHDKLLRFRLICQKKNNNNFLTEIDAEDFVFFLFLFRFERETTAAVFIIYLYEMRNY
jgi:hypothetical protein